MNLFKRLADFIEILDQTGSGTAPMEPSNIFSSENQLMAPVCVSTQVRLQAKDVL